MKIQDEPIIPGVGIGNIKLNMTKDQLIGLIGNDFKESLLGRGTRIEIENAKFWVSEDGKIYQIGVENDFKGKYKGIIGIGSTLSEVKKIIGNYVEVYDTYEMENEEGICFELEDIDDWDPLVAPIDHIYVFRI